MKKITLTERADMVIKASPGLSTLKPVIEKELVHYDVFFLLQQKELVLPNMAFIGGTGLRLCYGSNRYSEDLDFHAGPDFQPRDFDAIRLEIERYLSDRYGLPVKVKTPKQLKNDPDYAISRANTWKIIIQTHPKQRDLPAQRIHIDIANVPTHDGSHQLIRTQYSNLPDGYDAMLFLSSSKTEILADKLVAIPARNNIKARDLWDIVWLQQQNTDINARLVGQKIIDHGMTNFKERLEARIDSLPVYFETGLFEQEMSRFLDSSRLAETVKRPEFLAYLKGRVEETLTMLHTRLYSLQRGSSEFTL